MKTSKLKVRPFIPFAKDEEKDGREPFAILKYGNIKIEIDYTILRYLTLDTKSPYMYKTCCIFNTSIEEIIKEMNLTLDKKLPRYHRDAKTERERKWLDSFSYNPLHPDNKEIIKE